MKNDQLRLFGKTCEICFKCEANRIIDAKTTTFEYTIPRTTWEEDDKVIPQSIERIDIFCCTSCSSRITHCEHCKDTHYKSNLHSTQHGDVCPRCLHEFYAQCEHCDENAKISNIREIEVGYINDDDDMRNIKICNKCAELERSCACCSSPFLIERDQEPIRFHGMETHLCEVCEYDTVTCESCGGLELADETRSIEVESESELFEDEDEEDVYETIDVCRMCNENHRYSQSRSIKNYSYKPSPKFLPEEIANHPFYGVELEVDCRGASGGPIAEGLLKRVRSRRDRIIYCKSDASLPPGGFEIVTQPATVDYHVNKFPWEKICSYLISKGVLSHKGSGCGIHIHRSRVGLTPTDITKMGIFINEQKPFVEKFARRKSCGYSEYYKKAGRYENSTLRRNAERAGARGAFNTGNSNTLELRIFKGSLIPNTIRAAVEFYDSLVKFVRHTSIPIISDDQKGWHYYVDYVMRYRKQHDNLYKYMLRMGILKMHKTSKKIASDIRKEIKITEK